MSRKKIEAGQAYVGLGVRSRLKQGLAKAQARLKAAGAGFRSVGSRLATGGGAITGAFGAAAKVFADTGDQLDKMSSRTGISVKSLSRLNFAANRSGASLQDVEKATQGMARTIMNAETGLTTATDSLDELGIGLNQLQGQTPEEQFLTIADAISKVEDPTKRSALAMRVFGKSGASMIPMLQGGREGMEELFKSSDKLGQTLSGDQATAAAQLTDAYGDLMGGIKGMVIQLGAAVAGPLTQFFNQAASLVAVGIEWIQNNQAIVTTIAAVGAGLAAAGGALMTAGVAASALASGIGVISAVLGAVLSPIGLVTAAIAGAATYFLFFTDAGKSTVDWFSDQFGKLQEVVVGTLGGIQDALQAGDLALAAEIGFTGLKLAVATIMKEVERIFGVSFEGLFKMMSEAGKQIGVLLARLNKLRVEGSNAIGDFLSWAGEKTGVLPEGTYKTLQQDQKRFTAGADAWLNDMQSFDAEKFGSDLYQSFDPDGLSAKLEALKQEAADARQATEDGRLEVESAGDVAVSTLQAINQAKAAFENFASFSGAGAARSGAGAKPIENKMLDESKKQTGLLEEIRDKPSGAFS